MATPNTGSTLARQSDGTIQVTFSLPWRDVEKIQEHVIAEEGEKVTIPGFRRGKAPISKIKEKITSSTLIEKTLSHFYSFFISDIINNHKIKPAIYPRIEVLKALDNDDWQVRAITCELPKIVLGDYRKTILEKVKTSPKKELTREEKEQTVLKVLVESIKIEIPKLLITEEANQRLSGLLARIEKLGLQLESYLTSIGKDIEKLRLDYDHQARNAIAIELILGEIADKEGVLADDNQIEEAIKAASAGDSEAEKRLSTPEQKNIIKNVLQRRTVLDSLLALV